jgi:hypothetical protein
MIARVLPVAMVVLSCGAAVGYGAGGDWRHCIYWAAAAVVTAAVTTF